MTPTHTPDTPGEMQERAQNLIKIMPTLQRNQRPSRTTVVHIMSAAEGAANDVIALAAEVERLTAENKRLTRRADRDGFLQFGLVALPYFVDENKQLRTISVARDASRWQR